MERKMLYVSILTVVLSALVSTNSQQIPKETWRWTTPATGLNLNMKMITVSANKGPVSFYPPYYSSDSDIEPYTQLPDPARHYPARHYPTRPYPTRFYRLRYYPARHDRTPPYPTPDNSTSRHYPTRPYPTRPYPTRPYPTRHYPTRPYPTRPYPTRHYPTRPYPTRHYPTRHYPTRHYPTRPYYTTPYPWSTTPPTSGVSVCLRYVTDEQASFQTLFLLSKSSSSPLRVGVSNSGYLLTFGMYRTNRLYLKPYIKFWPNIGEDIWTRVCFTVDSVRNVAQAFSGSNMSIRKRLTAQYSWRGEPIIDFFSFDGQVTDVQIWDYPLRYTEVLQYMNGNVYGPYSGSVLTWSYISYSPSGNALLEDSYEWQQKTSIMNIKAKKGRRTKGQKKTMKLYDQGESNKQQL